MSAPAHLLEFAGAMEQAAEKAMAAGMSSTDFYHMLGTFVGYAAANDPRADREAVADAINLVVATALTTAETRLGQSRGTVQ